MKIVQLKAFLAIHETGSLQAASQRLHISQSALSRSIKELEQDLGALLLNRGIRGTTITRYGESLLHYARHALGDLDRARQEIESMKGEAGQQVTVGVTSSVTFMPPVQESLAEFVTAHPHTRLHMLELRPQQILPMLREGTMDFALLSLPPRFTSTLEWLPICRVPLHVVTRRDNPLRHARSLHELSEAPWLTQDLAYDEHSALGQLFRENGMALPTHVMECPAIGLMAYLLYHTPALTLMARWSLEHPVDPGFPKNMAILDLVEPVPDNFLSLVCLDRNLMTRSASELFTRMREKLVAMFPDFR